MTKVEFTKHWRVGGLYQRSIYQDHGKFVFSHRFGPIIVKRIY